MVRVKEVTCYLDTLKENNPVCPYCGFELDAVNFHESCDNVECPYCKEHFNLIIETKFLYSTRRKECEEHKWEKQSKFKKTYAELDLSTFLADWVGKTRLFCSYRCSICLKEETFTKWIDERDDYWINPSEKPKDW